MTDPPPHDALAAVLRQHDIQLTQPQIDQLAAYCRVLWAWNERLNLTRHTDYRRFVSRDVVDCVQLSALLREGEAVLDVGSGGGVPGIVLAVLRPDLRMTVCESVGKKARALEDIVCCLERPISVLPRRAEDLLGEFRYDSLVARAVGPLWKMLKWFQPHWPSIGRLLTVKGPRWVEERSEARHRGYLRNLELRRVASYAMPGTESESVILQIRPKGGTG